MKKREVVLIVAIMTSLAFVVGVYTATHNNEYKSAYNELVKDNQSVPHAYAINNK